MTEILAEDHYAAPIVRSLHIGSGVLLARLVPTEGKQIAGWEVNRYQVIKGINYQAGAIVHVSSRALMQCVVPPQGADQPIVFVKIEDVLAEELTAQDNAVVPPLTQEPDSCPPPTVTRAVPTNSKSTEPRLKTRSAGRKPTST